MDGKEQKISEFNDIEVLADKIKNGNLNPVKKQILQSKLADKLLRKINLASFAQLDKNIDKTADEIYNADKYNGEIFSKAYIDSLKRYGELDKNTGERIPFIKLFIAYYKIKKQALFQLKIEENTIHGTKIKRDAVKMYLRKVAKKHGFSAASVDDNVNNVLNYDKSRKFLISIGATEKEMSDFDEIFDTIRVSADEVSNDEDAGSYNQSDSVYQNQYDENNTVLLDLTDNIEKAFEYSKDEKFKQYVRSYISLKIIEYLSDGNRCVELADYVDKDFAKGYLQISPNERDTMSVDEILAVILGKKPDTIRKKRKEIEKFLLKISSERG